MTEDEAQQMVNKMRREAWVAGLVGLAVTLCLTSFNIITGQWWWVPLNIVGLGLLAFALRRLIEQEERERS